MADNFGNLDKYEKSFIRSQLRHENRRVRSLQTRRPGFLDFIVSLIRRTYAPTKPRIKKTPLYREVKQNEIVNKENFINQEKPREIKKIIQEPLINLSKENNEPESMKKITDTISHKVKKTSQATGKLFDQYLAKVGEQSERLQSQDLKEGSSYQNFSSPKSFLPIMANLTKKIQKKVSTLKKGKSKSWIKNILFLIASVILLTLIFFAVWFSTLKIPDVSTFDQRKISNSTKIYDRTGEIILYDIHEDIRRTVVPFDQINQSAKDAIVAIEDHTFYEHNGVVVSSTVRAVLQTVLSKLGLSNEGTAGGSTITQQVVKNTLLNSRKLVSRKVKEWVLAYKIENKLSKEQILEIYLNEAPYGGTIYGIQEASRIFFGVSAVDLTIGQSAYLAAIPNLPTYYSPYGPNKAELDKRQRLVLQEMKRYGYITDEQYRAALEEEVIFLPQEESGAKALHFVEYIRAYLEKTYGADLVENGGLKVITTLDYELQERGEQILKDHIAEVKATYDASNSALVAIESSTGQILTMIGSQDYYDVENEGNFNVATALRQPGSAFKPIAYANAFEKGFLPETVVFDTRTQFVTNCDPNNFESDGTCYAPNNHDGKFLGPMSLRNALAQSRNIPAIKMLYLGGIKETIKLAQNLGITSLTKDSNFYGLGLVLGGGEVSLLELTNAYAVFSSEGVYHKPQGILSVEDSEGNMLEEYQANESRVLSENVARMISSILSDNAARAPLFGSQSFLNFGGTNVAAKTGTTNDNRDAWLVGYTSSVALGVWTGNNDNTPMKKGSTISGKPWRSFMDEVIKKYPAQNFTNYSLPSNFSQLPAMVRGVWQGGDGTRRTIDSRTGEPADETTPEEFKKEVGSFDPHTILHYISKDNPTVNNASRSDSQYRNWEASVQAYAQSNFQQEYQDSLQTSEVDNLSENSNSMIGIQGFNSQREYSYEDSDKISVSFDELDIDDVVRVDFFINDSLFGSDSNQPFNIDLEFSQMNNLKKDNVLKVLVTTHSGQELSAQESFTVTGVPVVSGSPEVTQ